MKQIKIMRSGYFAEHIVYSIPDSIIEEGVELGEYIDYPEVTSEVVYEDYDINNYDEEIL